MELTRFERACYQCGHKVTANTKEQFNRTFGMHMRNTHNHAGVKTNWYDQPYPGQVTKVENPIKAKKRWSEMNAEERRQYHRDWAAAHPKKKKASAKVKEKHEPSENSSKSVAVANAIQVSLSQCPICKARFYAVTNEH